MENSLFLGVPILKHITVFSMYVQTGWMHGAILIFFYSLGESVVVVALLFYVHGKHLRSCRDGQLT